jgi:hypothetical protein
VQANTTFRCNRPSWEIKNKFDAWRKAYENFKRKGRGREDRGEEEEGRRRRELRRRFRC